MRSIVSGTGKKVSKSDRIALPVLVSWGARASDSFVPSAHDPSTQKSFL